MTVRLAAATVACSLLVSCVAQESPVGSRRQAAQATVTGELKQWHRVTLTFDGPQSSESAATNPFTDYRLEVTFSSSGKSYKVPGFFACDGDAGNTGASAGTKWRVHFSPPSTGTWSYAASFRTGADVALATTASAGSATSFDGASGTFTVAASDKTGTDHRAHGLLEYVGGHHLRFAGSGKYFLKGGADSPENFLAYYEFDGTTPSHKYAPHAAQFKTGDPTWAGGKGKNIIGALNYLAGKGMNSVYFLTMNVNGDGKDVWPWTASSERARFDCSKLDQWEVVFSHMDQLGIMLHVLTQETENDQLLDGGSLGNQRKLYYRELMARFGHHLALVWNLGEENTNTDQQRKDFASFFKAVDPYSHPVVVHTFPGQYSQVYTPLLGFKDFDGPSLQMGDMTKTHSETKTWIDSSAQAGHKWFVSLDEIGPASTGVATDTNDYWHDSVRHHALWGNLMAGGAGVEWYFGYQQPHDDLDCEDWSSRDHMWDLTRFALEFFQKHLPFWKMKSDDGLLSGTSGWCLAAPGEAYALYLPSGGSPSLTLPAGDFDVAWYSPRTGGSLQQGTVTSVKGGSAVSLGDPPADKSKDWAVLVTAQGSPAALKIDSFSLIDADTDQVVGTFDPLPDGATINLAFMPSKALNIRANVNGSAGSVVFDLDGQSGYRTESTAPFALAGDTSGDYNAWTPSLGNHSVTATPFSGSGGTGSAGTPLTVSFSVVDDPSARDSSVPDGNAMDGSTSDGPVLSDGAAEDSPGGSSDSAVDNDDTGCECNVTAAGSDGALALLVLLLLLSRLRTS